MCSDVPNRFTHATVVAQRLLNGPLIIDQIRRDADSLRFHFIADPPYDYTVEYTDSFPSTNWVEFGTYRAKLHAIDITVTNAFSGSFAHFFRVRKFPCNCR